MATILIQLASLVTLSRLLPPEDFGVIAMITAVTAFMNLFRDMGLSTASIQQGHLSHAQMNLLFWLNAAAGLILMLIVMALAPLIALFYNKPELKVISVLLSSTFFIASLGAQHAALMQRDLRFRPKAVADVTGALVNLVLAIILAYQGWRFWALALGTVAGVATTTLLYFSFSKFRPGWPRKAEDIRPLLGFGANVTAFEIVNYFSRNLDNILIGRFWGASALGFYSRAYQMMMLPIISLRTPINAVAYPVLSKLQGDPEEFRRYYCRIASLLAFLSMPLMAFLTVNARMVVTVALGENWVKVVPIFVMLGITGLLQPVASLRGLVLLSLGKSQRYLAWGVMNAVAVSIAFCIGISWGGIGIASAYAVSNYLILYPSLLFAFSGTPVKPIDFFATVALPFFASLLAGFVNWVVVKMVPSVGVVFSLWLAFCTFLPCFFLVFLVLPAGRSTLRSYYNIARGLGK